MFLMISQLNGRLQKRKIKVYSVHPQLIHMALQEAMVIKGI
jgi:hypothetical protein